MLTVIFDRRRLLTHSIFTNLTGAVQDTVQSMMTFLIYDNSALASTYLQVGDVAAVL